MKKLISSFVLLAAIVLFNSCSEKFNVAAPYKDITVIYSFLDMNDTAHYVRIQKAFLDQNKSAITMAQSSDSSYYAHLNVKIKRLDFSDTLVIDTIHLTRVDLNAEGYPKQPGVFFTAPNYAYKFTNTLNPNYLYRIIVTNLATGQVDSAEAPVIDDTKGGAFTSTVFTDTASIDFSSTLPRKTYEFYCQYTPPSSFTYENQTSPAVIAQAILRFNWVDSDYTTHTNTARSGDYNVGYQTLNNSGFGVQIDYSIPNLQLYNAMSSTLGAAPDHVIRLLDKIDLFVYLGTQDFLNYQQNSLVQGVGLTGSEIEPVYTNVKGANALGLFTSRGMRQGKLKITNTTIDSLMASPLMVRNNIKGRVN